MAKVFRCFLRSIRLQYVTMLCRACRALFCDMAACWGELLSRLGFEEIRANYFSPEGLRKSHGAAAVRPRNILEQPAACAFSFRLGAGDDYPTILITLASCTPVERRGKERLGVINWSKLNNIIQHLNKPHPETAAILVTKPSKIQDSIQV